MKQFMLGVLFTLFLLSVADGHSTMTQPQSTSPFYCSAEEEGFCSGPCDLRAVEDEEIPIPHDGPNSPAATYGRGETFRVKYVRNNHRAGGFLRLAIVRPEDIMDKGAHNRGAFHYSCWGAKVKVANEEDKEEDELGFITIGNDGEEHDLPPAYYSVDVKIPRVVPDGNYVLGYVWYGGTAGPVTRNIPQQPFKYGQSSDYWSCSYIRVKGGKSLKKSYRPRFRNDMTQFSKKGCRSINNAPDVCPGVPCDTEESFYRVPGPFEDGKKPKKLRQSQFRG